MDVAKIALLVQFKEYSDVCQIELTTLRHRLHYSATPTSKKGDPSKELKEGESSSYKKKFKPFYDDCEMRKDKRGKWWVIPAGGGEWLEYADKEDKIEWN